VTAYPNKKLSRMFLHKKNINVSCYLFVHCHRIYLAIIIPYIKACKVIEPVSGQWAVGSGLWAVDSEQWTVGSGQWTVGSGQWAVGSGQWALRCVQPLVRKLTSL
jgi:hypothetical protein